MNTAVWNAALVFEDRERGLVVPVVARIARELLQRAIVLGTHPGQRTLAFDVFEPEKGIRVLAKLVLTMFGVLDMTE